MYVMVQKLQKQHFSKTVCNEASTALIALHFNVDQFHYGPNRPGRFEHGWGWALYKPDDREKNIASNYKTDRLGCHIPAKRNDRVYTEAYPTLSSN